MYEIHKCVYMGSDVETLLRRDGSDCYTSIPFDPANIDYQEYLKWLDDGNTPEPAEEQ